MTEVSQASSQDATKTTSSELALNSNMSTYDTRAFGDFGWEFVNAGESYRTLSNVPDEDKMRMLGLFKQATIGDCDVDDAARKQKAENANRKAWLEFKGMDSIDAMQAYIDHAKKLVAMYPQKEAAASSATAE